MKMFIGLSATDVKFKKGDRVVCKVGKNEWYLGTVVRGGAKLKIDFDDGHEADIDPADLGDVKLVPIDTKPRKKFLTNMQAMQLYKVKMAPKKPVASKTSAKPTVKPLGTRFVFGDDKIASDPSLYKSFKTGRYPSTLLAYLEGEAVPQAWLDIVDRRYPAARPNLLYRLCVVPEKTKIDSTVRITKQIASASDQKANAIYAGCSYHNDNRTSLEGKKLALVELDRPHPAITFSEIVEVVKQVPHNDFILKRVIKEREYIVHGPTSGIAIQILPTSLITSGAYRSLVKEDGSDPNKGMTVPLPEPVTAPSGPINNAALDEKLKLLKHQQKKLLSGFTPLQKYLHGSRVSDSWLEEFSKRRSNERPAKLYRLCSVKDSAVGRTVNISKSIVSSSDRIMNAIFAGCSFMANHLGANIESVKQLALIEITRPKVVMSLNELLNIMTTREKPVLEDEREYILAGPLKGKVIAMLDREVVTRKRYLSAMHFVQRDEYDPIEEAKLLERFKV